MKERVNCRKRCKNCSCNLQDHDVVLEADHAQIVIGKGEEGEGDTL